MASYRAQREEFIARFVSECTHGSFGERIREARNILRKAVTAKRAAVALCNGDIEQDKFSTVSGRCGASIRLSLAKTIPVADVLVGGDPRECVVKLTKLPSQYTDDWGREGFCVPTPDI